jgi:putative molybdopterin biosynthesis protein
VTVRFAGSHDLALEALLSRLRQARPALTTTTAFVGSLDGLLALLHGEADLAGAHILDEATGQWNIPILQRVFPGRRFCAVTLAEREQGLIVASGNPLRLGAWVDLGRTGLRFVNRQPGSGTRTLLDLQLRRAGIAAEGISGYDFVVPTHLAAAAVVAEGRADAALGLYAAARAYDLAFVPLASERYDLVFALGSRSQWLFNTVLDVLRSAEFQSLVMQLGGYGTRLTGKEIHT